MTSPMNSQSARSFGQALHFTPAVAPSPRRLREAGALSLAQPLRASSRLPDLDRTAGRVSIPVVGSGAIAERLGSQLATATGEVSWLRCGDEPDVSILESVAAAIDASRIRILQHGGDQPVPQALAGAELRVTGARPSHDFLLVGDELAFIFDRAETDQQVMIPVSHASVAKAFLGVFDHLWSAALPVTEIQHELDSEARRIIIRMLGDGATDDAIARALGISRRTIARHVAQIMHCTGALSRFQAGMRLAQLGLLASGRS